MGVRNIPCVVMSQKLIDWWLLEKDISRRIDGVALGEDFFATGVLRHSKSPSYSENPLGISHFIVSLTVSGIIKHVVTTNSVTSFLIL